MPVLILLDHSLGMAQKRCTPEGRYETLFDYAQTIVGTILEHLRLKNPLEVVQLFLFSSEIEPFSELVRDSECIIQALTNFKNFTSKALLNKAFEYVKNIIQSGKIGNAKNLLYDVIVISRQTVINDSKSFQAIQEQFPFPQYCNLHFVCCDFVSEHFQTQLINSFSFLQKKARHSDLTSVLYSSPPAASISPPSYQYNSAIFTPVIPTSALPDSNTLGLIITGNNRNDIHRKLVEGLNIHFVPLSLQLICGTLSGRLILFPTLPNSVPYKTRLYIQGFLPVSDVANCTILSRHLIQPIADTIVEVFQKNAPVWPKNALDNETIEKSFENPSSRPHFCAMLKKSLLKNKCAAICTVDYTTTISGKGYTNGIVDATTTTGFIMPQQEESGWLQFYLFDKMPDWIDDLSISTHKNVREILPSKKIDSSKAIILHESIVQTDIAKVFRYARRLPDRKDAVLTEMGKFVKLVRSCYFQGLGLTLISILERELAQPETKAEYLLPIITELKLELGL